RAPRAGARREPHLRDRLRRCRLLGCRAGNDDPVRGVAAQDPDACRATRGLGPGGRMIPLAVVISALAPGPHLAALRVTNGTTPFEGDRRLVTTFSPNGHAFR